MVLFAEDVRSIGSRSVMIKVAEKNTLSDFVCMLFPCSKNFPFFYL
jgi:hypothetical protein